MSSLIRWPVRSRGQGLVEFALTIILLLFLVFGLIEAARWFYGLNAVQHAAFEAARYASTGQPSRPKCVALGYPTATSDPAEYVRCRVDSIKQFAIGRAKLGQFFYESEADVTKPGFLGVYVDGTTFGTGTISNHPGGPRGRVKVRVVYNLPVLNPLLARMLPSLRVEGYQEMVNEPWAGGGPDVPPTFAPATPLPPLDSDGDGWSDSYEVSASGPGTSPSTPDTDGDGYCEGVQASWSAEVAALCAGYDNYPLDPDEH